MQEAMAAKELSLCFEINMFFWKLLGIWSGLKPAKYYNYYSFLYLAVTLIFYNILATVNLIYTPRKIEVLIREVIFYFTEIAIMIKALVIILWRKKIVLTFQLLDHEDFMGSDMVGKKLIEKHRSIYMFFWKITAIFSNFSYFSHVALTAFFYLIRNNTFELPICQYYFLSDEFKEKYFVTLFIYQAVSSYSHMMYTVVIDTYMAGLIYMAVGQLRVMKHNLRQLTKDTNTMENLKPILQHYALIVKYCYYVQDIVSYTMFTQFFMSSAIICVVMCGLLMVSSTGNLLFIVSYSCIMIMQIFVPAYLGTQLSEESENLMTAAYNTDWVPQSESFKRSLCLFVERAKRPIVITVLKMFPLSLGTFLSVIKMAYSFFTLVRKLQDRQVAITN